MGDLEQAGWEKEIASQVTAIQCADDLLPFLKTNFDPGPVCLHINSNAMAVLHSYSTASPRPAPKKPSLGRVAGSKAAATVSSQSIPSWLDRQHRSELSIVLRAYARLTRYGTDACIIFTGWFCAPGTLADLQAMVVGWQKSQTGEFNEQCDSCSMETCENSQLSHDFVNT